MSPYKILINGIYVKRDLFEQPSESRRYLSLKLHALMGHRMGEAKHIGMKTQAVNRVITISILYVAAHGMPHIS